MALSKRLRHLYCLEGHLLVAIYMDVVFCSGAHTRRWPVREGGACLARVYLDRIFIALEYSYVFQDSLSRTLSIYRKYLQ